MAAGSPTADRKPAARRQRRGGGMRVRVGRNQGAGDRDPRRRHSARGGDQAECAGAAVQSRRGGADGAAVRARAGAPDGETGRDRAAQGRREGRQRRIPAGAAKELAGGVRGGDVAGAAGRSGAADAELRGAAERRPGIQSGQHSRGAAAVSARTIQDGRGEAAILPGAAGETAGVAGSGGGKRDQHAAAVWRDIERSRGRRKAVSRETAGHLPTVQRGLLRDARHKAVNWTAAHRERGERRAQGGGGESDAGDQVFRGPGPDRTADQDQGARDRARAAASKCGFRDRRRGGGRQERRDSRSCSAGDVHPLHGDGGVRAGHPGENSEGSAADGQRGAARDLGGGSRCGRDADR